MAGHKYINNSSSLFEEDEVNDDDFVDSYRTRNYPPQTTPKYGGHIAELERQRQQMLERKKEIEQRTIDSSARSIGLLRNSEQIGIATAEELMRQREQLENTNKRLDEINTNLNYSQKHLNGIKSVFYGLKNYISGKSDSTPPRSQTSPSSRNTNDGPSSSRLENTLNNVPSDFGEAKYDSHPSTRLRGLDQTTTSESRRVEDILDANLEEMLQNITRLKGLGTALGDEIDKQNDLIDTIHDKTEVADIKIGKQTKDMNKLLGK